MKHFAHSILALFILTISHPLLGQEFNGVFRPAIEKANKRTVKIFGATVGNVEGYGAGILISNDGLIITGQGVYLTGNSVRVALHDGKTYEAEVLRTDPNMKLALLKIDAKVDEHFKLSEKPIGEKGDWVLGVSNPFKVAERDEPLSVTLGVYSLRTSIEVKTGRREDILYSGELILIDAITSNPGAPGGAVVTTDGDLIGMIGKVINSPETNTRMNYAVPAERLLDFVNGKSTAIVSKSKTNNGEKATLGIKLFRLGGPNAPAYVDRVIRGTPAADAKIRPDDLIVSVAGKRIGNIRDYAKVLDELVPGVEVVVVYKRRVKLERVKLTPVPRK